MFYRRNILALLGAIFGVGMGPLSAAEQWLEEDYTTILNNVKAVHMSGVSGSVALLGRRAFPLAISTQNKVVVAAGYFGDQPRGGRLVAMTHTSFADGNSEDAALFLGNLARWAGRSGRPRLVCVGAATKGWEAAGVQTTLAAGNLKEILSEADVAVVNLHNGTMKDAAEELTKFAGAGGGVILIATPWAAPGPQLEAGNELLGRAGLTMLGAGGKEAAYPVKEQTPSAYWSALNAIDAAVAYRRGLIKLDPADLQLCAASIDAALSAKTLSPELQSAVNYLNRAFGRIDPGSVATAKGKADKPLDAAIARYQARMPGSVAQ